MRDICAIRSARCCNWRVLVRKCAALVLSLEVVGEALDASMFLVPVTAALLASGCCRSCL